MSLIIEPSIEFSGFFAKKRLSMNQSAQLYVPDGGIVYMDSLGPCIGYVGFDPNRRIIFGKHFPIHEEVDQDLFQYQAQLHQLGISTQNTALAGGNLNRAENFADYYTNCQKAKSRILSSGARSYMLQDEAPAGIVDYLAVKLIQDIYLFDHFRFN